MTHLNTNHTKNTVFDAIKLLDSEHKSNEINTQPTMLSNTTRRSSVNAPPIPGNKPIINRTASMPLKTDNVQLRSTQPINPIEHRSASPNTVAPALPNTSPPSRLSVTTPLLQHTTNTLITKQPSMERRRTQSIAGTLQQPRGPVQKGNILIELELSGENLPTQSSMITLLEPMDGQKPRLLGYTEIIRETNRPKFMTRLELEYRPDSKQKIQLLYSSLPTESNAVRELTGLAAIYTDSLYANIGKPVRVDLGFKDKPMLHEQLKQLDSGIIIRSTVVQNKLTGINPATPTSSGLINSSATGAKYSWFQMGCAALRLPKRACEPGLLSITLSTRLKKNTPFRLMRQSEWIPAADRALFNKRLSFRVLHNELNQVLRLDIFHAKPTDTKLKPSNILGTVVVNFSDLLPLIQQQKKIGVDISHWKDKALDKQFRLCNSMLALEVLPGRPSDEIDTVADTQALLDHQQNDNTSAPQGTTTDNNLATSTSDDTYQPVAERWSALLEQGVVVVKHHSTSTKSNERLFFIDINKDQRVLLWCKPGINIHNSYKRLELLNKPDILHINTISNILLGKVSTVLQRKEASKSKPEVCFSIVTGKRTIDIECGSMQVRNQFVNDLFKLCGKRSSEFDAYAILDSGMNILPTELQSMTPKQWKLLIEQLKKLGNGNNDELINLLESLIKNGKKRRKNRKRAAGIVSKNTASTIDNTGDLSDGDVESDLDSTSPMSRSRSTTDDEYSSDTDEESDNESDTDTISTPTADKTIEKHVPAVVPMLTTEAAPERIPMMRLQWNIIDIELLDWTFWSSLQIPTPTPHQDTLTELWQQKQITKMDTEKKQVNKGNIIDNKKSQAILIALKKLTKEQKDGRVRGMTHHEILHSLMKLDLNEIQCELLYNCYKQFTDSEYNTICAKIETYKLEQEKHGALGLCEQFIDTLSVIRYNGNNTKNRVLERLQDYLYTLQFASEYTRFTQKMHKLLQAGATIIHSTKQGNMRIIYALILYIGNYMNQGTNKGNTKGFKFEFLTRMNTLKANDSTKTSFLQYVVNYIIEHYWCEQSYSKISYLYELECIAQCYNDDIEQYRSDIVGLQEQYNTIKTKLKHYEVLDLGSSMKDMYVERMTAFVDRYSNKITELINTVKQIDTLEQYIKILYGVQKDPLNLQNIYELYYMFMQQWKHCESVLYDSKPYQLEYKIRLEQQKQADKNHTHLLTRYTLKTVCTTVPDDMREYIETYKKQKAEAELRLATTHDIYSFAMAPAAMNAGGVPVPPGPPPMAPPMAPIMIKSAPVAPPMAPPM